MAEMDYSKSSPFSYRENEYLTKLADSNALNEGEETMRRRDIASGASAVSNQSMRLTYFTARKTESISRVRILSGTTAAAATPTLCRIGVYKEEDNGDLTLVGSTANDTTLFVATATEYTRNLISPFDKIQNQRYAVGILVVSAVATPTFYGHVALPTVIAQYSPVTCKAVSGQADLPSTVASASLGNASQSTYAVLLP